MKQDVVVLLSRAPYGRVHVPEGLRAARGVAAGFDHHDVTVVYLEDGVYAARDGVDREVLNMSPQIEDLHAEDGRMVVDASALADRAVDHDEVAEDIAIRSAREISTLINDADEVLTF
ncbi:MAG: sulfur relay (sulfurtransferase) DsrF/TusC family protein [Halobacteriales archaeon]|jgi:sulfur relay (sulfurtransferase) DsrF/TusC family protein